MSQVALTADIHFGVPNKQQDILWAAQTIRQYCYEHGIDTVIVLGDLFHDRDSLGIDVLYDAFNFFRKAKEMGQQWIAFPGNHDMYLRHSWRVNSLNPLSELITIIEDVRLMEIENRRFWVLPFIEYESLYMKAVHAIEEEALPDDILLTHIGVCRAIRNSCYLLRDWGQVTFNNTKFKRVYTGHFHCYQNIDKVWYPGSPIPLKSDEGDTDHGFMTLDLETMEHKFHNIWTTYDAVQKTDIVQLEHGTPPQFCTIPDTDITSVPVAMINNANIRIRESRNYTDTEKDTIAEALRAQGARSVRWLYVNTDEEEQVRLQVDNRLNNLDTLFRQYAEADPNRPAELSLPLLMRLNAEICQEGDEKYYAEHTEI